LGEVQLSGNQSPRFKRFQEYEKHRDRFATAEDFASWYNNRLHGSLWLEMGERPNEAFQRKLKPECLLWLFFRLTGS
jgi:putative transposase